jgi:hypothetical protein
MTTATTRPAGASGTAKPVASAGTSPAAWACADGLGGGEALIVGNSPDALPGETTVLPDPDSVGPASVGRGMGGSVGPAPTLAGAVLRLPEAGAGARPVADRLVADGAGVVLAGLGAGLGVDAGVAECVGAGAATGMAAPAAGGVHGSTVGTLAVAVSDTEVPPAEAGTCACISTLDAEPSTFIVAIQHDADPLPTGQPDV